MVIFHQKSSCVKGRLPSGVILRQRSSSVKGRLLLKVLFLQRSSSVKSRLLSKVVFCQWMSSVEGCPFCIVFEIFYYKANTCANNLALSLIVMCPLLHCRHSCQFTFSWVCRVHCLCYVCTLILYIGLLYCTVVQKFLSDRSEHRIHPGDTTHHTSDTTHDITTQTESNVELGFPD